MIVVNIRMETVHFLLSIMPNQDQIYNSRTWGLGVTLPQPVALPAVVLPDFLNDGRSLDRASIVVPGLQVQQHSFTCMMMSTNTIQSGAGNITIALTKRKQISSQ